MLHLQPLTALIAFLIALLLLVLLRFLNTRWSKKCYFCSRKLGKIKHSTTWVIEGNSVAVCYQCVPYVYRRVYGKSLNKIG